MNAKDRIERYHPWLMKTANALAQQYEAEFDDCYQMLALALAEGHNLRYAFLLTSNRLARDARRNPECEELGFEPKADYRQYRLSIETRDSLVTHLTVTQMHDLVRWLMGETHKVIAQSRGVDRSAVSYAIRRAKKNLKPPGSGSHQS